MNRLGTGSAVFDRVALEGPKVTRALRVAIADDDPVTRQFLQETLVDLGHEVVAAAPGGIELAQKCRTLRPDLIVADIQMPDMDGIQSALEIYFDQPTPVILISAYRDPGLVERARVPSVMHYLVKPVERADLARAIDVALTRFEHQLGFQA